MKKYFFDIVSSFGEPMETRTGKIYNYTHLPYCEVTHI